MRRLALAAVVIAAAPAAAAPLGVVKASSVVSDGVDAINPKAIPGARLDYTITVTNPAANLTAAVTAVTVVDPLPATVKLCLADLAAPGGGPVEFVDGNLLGLGLLGSGLTFGFTSLASGSDSVDFSTDGVSWSYVPAADASGCDPQVRAIRVRLTGSQTAASGFRLRFRVMVK